MTRTHRDSPPVQERIDGCWRQTARTSGDVPLPFVPLPPISPEKKEALRGEALRVNDRYLKEVVEGHNFCPFAKRGRQLGETARYVHFAQSPDVEPLLTLMQTIADNDHHAVSQVIFPLVEVDPKPWRKFVLKLTELGHSRMHGSDVLAVAALHPRLSFSEVNPYALVPLFRRAPDPTIQWVRLDSLEALYAGVERGTRFVNPEDAPPLLLQPCKPSSLYDRVAEANQSTARRLSIPTVVAALDGLAGDARRSYAAVLNRSDD